MEYAYIGGSDLHASTIAFGCMSLAGDAGEAGRLIHRAMDLGINFFDTADLYGKGWNEEMVGRALKGRRDKAIVCTKVGNQWRPDGSGWDWNPSGEYITRAVEASLGRLGTDRIDLYLLHGGMIEDPIDETIDAFERLQHAGKIRYYGISSIRPNVIREYVRKSHIVAVMTQYSLLDRRPEETVLGLLRTSGIGVLARGPLAQGLLVDKPAVNYLNYSAQQVAKMAAAVHSHSGNGRSSSQTALRFAIVNPAVSTVVSGIRTLSQLEEAAATTVTATLTKEEVEDLTGTLPTNVYKDHR